MGCRIRDFFIVSEFGILAYGNKMYLNRTAFQTMNYFRTLNAFIILLWQTSQHFFKCIYREKFQLSVYANKSVTYYTTFGKEENQKLHYFNGWSGLYFLCKPR